MAFQNTQILMMLVAFTIIECPCLAVETQGEDSPHVALPLRQVKKGPVSSMARKILWGEIDEVTVRQICQKYNHCNGGELGIRHFQNLNEFINQLLQDQRLKDSNGSAAGLARVNLIQYDLDRLNDPLHARTKRTQRRILSLAPFKPEVNSCVLEICAKYKHCVSDKVDSLHCYQLESFLLKLESEKLKMAQTPECIKAIESLNSDLQKLSKFESIENPLRPYRGDFGGWF